MHTKNLLVLTRGKRVSQEPAIPIIGDIFARIVNFSIEQTSCYHQSLLSNY